MEYGLRNIESWDWVTLILLGSFALVAITRHSYPRRFQEFLLLALSDKYFNLQGKAYQIQHPFNILLFTVQVLSFSLFFYLLLYRTQSPVADGNQWLFVQLVTGFTVWVLMKIVIEKMIAHIFNIEDFINGYLYEKLSYTSLISLVLLPANIVFYFAFKPSETVLVTCAVVLATLYLISLLSSFKRNWNLILRHFYYFILYLCALEIAPYIILYFLLV